MTPLERFEKLVKTPSKPRALIWEQQKEFEKLLKYSGNSVKQDWANKELPEILIFALSAAIVCIAVPYEVVRWIVRKLFH
jgi:hypothetical protein